MRKLAIALVHYPILDRNSLIVTTAITNLDIHDIARSSFTYGVERFFLIHPVAAQRELAARVKEHWTVGSGARRIPDRRPPMECVELVSTLEEARSSWGSQTETWVTSAQPLDDAISYAEAAACLRGTGPSVLLVLGTGWGLAPEVTDAASLSLAPIVSPRPDGYNHLSVRAAAAIILDRLLGSQ